MLKTTKMSGQLDSIFTSTAPPKPVLRPKKHMPTTASITAPIPKKHTPTHAPRSEKNS